MSKKIISELGEAELKGKRVLVRVDFNVPLDAEQCITDDTRIRAALPTIKFLLEREARVVLCSHLGRPDGEVVEKLRLAPIGRRLAELLDTSVQLANDCVGEQVAAQVAALQDGQILLLENLRFHAEEEANEPTFAKQLGAGIDVYVNDAFGAAHRAHASTAGVADYVPQAVAGFLMDKELKYLKAAVEQPQRPFGAIIGGSKVSTKITVIESLLEKCDILLLGGGMMFTFLKARGLEVGASLVEEDKVDLARELEAKALAKGVKLLLPVDVVVADAFKADALSKEVVCEEIPAGWLGLDIGSRSVAVFRAALQDCRTILWNGPMGVFEFERFAAGTLGIAQALAQLTRSGATTIIGGGDSVAAVEQAGLADQMSHISTGGGASLELLEGRELPGVAALNDNYRNSLE